MGLLAYLLLCFKQSNNLYVNWRKLIIPLMIDTNLELDQYLLVSNRGADRKIRGKNDLASF
jgi:hypothetical protein